MSLINPVETHKLVPIKYRSSDNKLIYSTFELLIITIEQWLYEIISRDSN